MMQPTDKCVLPGLYGKETMEEWVLNNPKLRDRRGTKGGERGEGCTLRRKGVVVEGDAEDESKGPDVEAMEPRRRKSSFGQWMSRKRTPFLVDQGVCAYGTIRVS